MRFCLIRPSVSWANALVAVYKELWRHTSVQRALVNQEKSKRKVIQGSKKFRKYMCVSNIDRYAASESTTERSAGGCGRAKLRHC